MGMSVQSKRTARKNKTNEFISQEETIEIKLYRQRYRRLFPSLPIPIMSRYPESLRWFVVSVSTYEILTECFNKAECIAFCREVTQDKREQVFLAKMSDTSKESNLFEYSGPVDRKAIRGYSATFEVDALYERKYLLIGTKEALLTEDLDQELREWDRKKEKEHEITPYAI